MDLKVNSEALYIHSFELVTSHDYITKWNHNMQNRWTLILDYEYNPRSMVLSPNKNFLILYGHEGTAVSLLIRINTEDASMILTRSSVDMKIETSCFRSDGLLFSIGGFDKLSTNAFITEINTDLIETSGNLFGLKETSPTDL